MTLSPAAWIFALLLGFSSGAERQPVEFVIAADAGLTFAQRDALVAEMAKTGLEFAWVNVDVPPCSFCTRPGDGGYRAEAVTLPVRRSAGLCRGEFVRFFMDRKDLDSNRWRQHQPPQRFGIYSPDAKSDCTRSRGRESRFWIVDDVDDGHLVAVLRQMYEAPSGGGDDVQLRPRESVSYVSTKDLHGRGAELDATPAIFVTTSDHRQFTFVMRDGRWLGRFTAQIVH